MDRILLRGGKEGVTVVSNIFLDKYMIKANGEYVKVYLYLLRCLSGDDKELSVGYLADVLENTESDVKRAIKYWAAQGLLSVDYEDGKIKAIQIMPLEEKEEGETKQNDGDTGIDALSGFMADEDVKMLLFAVQKYIGKTMNSTETDIILYIYGELGFSVELIEYLVEYCVSNNHKDMRYIEKAALNWHENKVTTIDEAKRYVAENSFYPIINALGIKGRTLGTDEKEWVAKWRSEYGFDMDVIVNACKRALANTNGQNCFKYTDSILRSWKKKGVKSVEDLKAVDEEHEKEREKALQRTAKKVSVAKPVFNNFSQRSYDYDAVEKLWLQRK